MRGFRAAGFLLLSGLTLFRLWYIGAGFLDLAPDEAHYWEWSRRLDWSYYSKGPIVAYLIASSTRLCGDTEFCVRLPAVLLAFGTVLLVYFLTLRLFGSPRAGFLAVLICAVIPLYAAGSILMTIDAPLVFFWALALFSVHKATSNEKLGSRETIENWIWWLLFGCALGLGLQSKYTMLFFLPCLGLYLLFSSRARSYLKHKPLYIALSLGILLFAPVVLWNARHDWVSFRHVMGQAGLLQSEVGSSTRTFWTFFGSQIGVLSPVLFFTLVAAMMRSAKLGLGEAKNDDLFLFSFSIPVLAFFLIWSLFQKVQANWAAPAYLAAAVALAGWWDTGLRRVDKSRRRVLWTGGAGVVLLPGALLVALGHFPAMLQWAGTDIAMQADPARKLRGWKELGAAVGKIRGKSHGKEIFFVSDSYQIASELAFYVPGQPRVYNINLGRRMNQYDIWGGLDTLEGRNLLIVTSRSGDVPPSMRNACVKVEKLEDITTFYRRHPAQFFSIFHCEGYKSDILPREKITF